MAATPDQSEGTHLWTDVVHITAALKNTENTLIAPLTSFIIRQLPLTSSYWNANQVVDESKHKVNPDSLDRLLREINAAHNIQEVILYTHVTKKDTIEEASVRLV